MTDPTSGITAARRAHSARCRQRVIKALNTAVTSGEEISHLRHRPQSSR